MEKKAEELNRNEKKKKKTKGAKTHPEVKLIANGCVLPAVVSRNNKCQTRTAKQEMRKQEMRNKKQDMWNNK